ncbi:hypothetical protein BDA99DRAFT_538767 [Phascolomyces articulosus]|uniref:Uncharacterized protein n=1 Tax=Phascolomyces articulosus TaxID=60185 RepID=A0AAD5K7B8_9FUNG|nr:hypothetical protein BDA99DRAFT_538767 [Phascolomyces articulosus]
MNSQSSRLSSSNCFSLFLLDSVQGAEPYVMMFITKSEIMFGILDLSSKTQNQEFQKYKFLSHNLEIEHNIITHYYRWLYTLDMGKLDCIYCSLSHTHGMACCAINYDMLLYPFSCFSYVSILYSKMTANNYNARPVTNAMTGTGPNPSSPPSSSRTNIPLDELYQYSLDEDEEDDDDDGEQYLEIRKKN